jgi:5-methylcytosine-specific restriction endonuclease McrA
MKIYQCLNCNKDCIWSRAKANKYCDPKCQQEYQYKTYIIEWKQGTQNGAKGQGEISGYVRRYLFTKFENKCCECGIDSWQGKHISLEIEHKDGNSLNQTEENLILLCPNCHSQTPTYKSKNRGNGRHSRKQRYQEGKSF